MNIGQACTGPLERLRNNPDWIAFREAFGEFAYSQMHEALSADDLRTVAYARAARDLWLTFEAMTTGMRVQHVDKRKMRPRAAAPELAPADLVTGDV